MLPNNSHSHQLNQIWTETQFVSVFTLFIKKHFHAEQEGVVFVFHSSKVSVYSTGANVWSYVTLKIR